MGVKVCRPGVSVVEEPEEQNVPHLSCTVALSPTCEVGFRENIPLILNFTGSRSNGLSGCDNVLFSARQHKSLAREARQHISAKNRKTFLSLLKRPDTHRYMWFLKGSTPTLSSSSSHAISTRSQMIQSNTAVEASKSSKK
jgi:hypothetical protein